MPPIDNQARQEAKRLYLESGGTEKLRIIAEKVGAKLSTVKGWKSRDRWDDELPKASVAKKTRGRPKKVKRPGAAGNQNAAGKHKNTDALKGKRNAAGPHRPDNYRDNKNAVRTGLYESIKYAFMTDEEKQLIGIMEEEPSKMELQIRLIAELEVRELRMYNRIAFLNAQKDKDGMISDTMTVRSENAASGDGSAKPSGTLKVSKSKKAVLSQIMDIELALSVVQRQKQAAINALHRMEHDATIADLNQQRIDLERRRLEHQLLRDNGNIDQNHDVEIIIEGESEVDS